MQFLGVHFHCRHCRRIKNTTTALLLLFVLLEIRTRPSARHYLVRGVPLLTVVVNVFASLDGTSISILIDFVFHNHSSVAAPCSRGLLVFPSLHEYTHGGMQSTLLEILATFGLLVYMTVTIGGCSCLLVRFRMR